MSGSLRVLAPEELELVAGGSLGDNWWDPNYGIAPGSAYSGMGFNVPVFSATSWTTSSFGNNYQNYANLANVPGSYGYNPNLPSYESTNAFLMANPYSYTPPPSTPEMPTSYIPRVTIVDSSNNQISSTSGPLSDGVYKTVNPTTGYTEIVVTANISEIIVSASFLEDPSWTNFSNMAGLYGLGGQDYLSLWSIDQALMGLQGAVDASSHDVQVDATNLTPEQQAAVQELKDAIARADNVIRNIPDNATVTLPNGDKVSGSELKQAWANTDFEVDPVGTIYANGSNRGEADYNNGNPVIRTTIDNLVNYVNSGGDGGDMGTNYLVFHELAHLTLVQQLNLAQYHTAGSHEGTNYSGVERHAHEQQANDIARAFATSIYGNLPFLANPDDGYGTPLPMTTP